MYLQGEGLPKEFDEAIERDRFVCDLVIVIGTSLKVAPVSEIIKVVPAEVPQILINRDPIYRGRRKTSAIPGQSWFEYEGDEFEFDICLFGQSDLILRELSRRLGPTWQLDHPPSLPGVPSPLGITSSDPVSGKQPGQQMDTSASTRKEAIQCTQFGQHINHIWLFPGANIDHSWFERWRILDQAGRDPVCDPPELSSSDESDSQLTKEDIIKPPTLEDVSEQEKQHGNMQKGQVVGPSHSRDGGYKDSEAPCIPPAVELGNKSFTTAANPAANSQDSSAPPKCTTRGEANESGQCLPRSPPLTSS
ncbi:uncharacterized protein VP01_7g2 [Puccinia sorghi]|uniref:Deacetylase sirtuin-type domain-containing protein n=1 Tax=Puccinia sorghi TaxID=27349 RepID=A0A0L6UBC3_9BASI|nr:uncharacterized protein VP01_7g2 [Puccinia sorghi]